MNPAPENPPAKTDPVCFHCGHPESKHFHEFGEVYCFENTTSDLFTEEPDAEDVGDWVDKHEPEIYQRARQALREDYGHEMLTERNRRGA
jgi:hypothetical protein